MLLNKRRKEPWRPPSISEKAIGRINSLQRNWIDYLAEKSRNLTGRMLACLLLLFCFVFGGSSLYVLLTSLKTTSFPWQLERMPFPKPNKIELQTHTAADSLLTVKEYHRIWQFKELMDSLQRSYEGKKTYDSIMKTRPHLLDSIQLMDSLFIYQ